MLVAVAKIAHAKKVKAIQNFGEIKVGFWGDAILDMSRKSR